MTSELHKNDLTDAKQAVEAFHNHFNGSQPLTKEETEKHLTSLGIILSNYNYMIKGLEKIHLQVYNLIGEQSGRSNNL